ncbi:MAG: carboxypeptidase-like regulatory domain-containing protein [Sphingobacteriales bacterium]|nr:carboxypeptidase-like regulatory domain-containing protein [Sphingobacteriales bacterium]
MKTNKMEKIILTIPEPCHENWNNMTAAEKGRFCASCFKEVMDFSLKTDEQIISYLNNANEKVCGRFESNQINRVLETPKKEYGFVRHLWTLLLPGFFFSTKSFAKKSASGDLQNKDSLVRTNPKPMILGMVARKIIPENKNEQIITGMVVDETNSPIAGASVYLKGAKIGTVTDQLGNFSIKIAAKPTDMILSVSSVGFTTHEVRIARTTKQEPQIIKLILKTQAMGEVVVTKAPARKKEKPDKATTVKETYPVVNNDVKMFPNPVAAGAACSLSFGKIERGNFSAIVTDINGKLVQQSTFYVPMENYLFHFDLDKNIVAGAYLLRVINANGKLFYNGKIVVE